MNVKNIIQKSETQEDSEDDDSGSNGLYERLKSDAVQLYRAIVVFLKSYFPIIVLLMSGLFGIFEAVGFSTGLPSHIVPYAIYWGYGTWGGLVPSALVWVYISKDDDQRVYTYQTVQSELARYAFPDNVLETVTVLNPDGEEIGMDELDIIHTAKYGMCYLGLGYDREANVLVASWFGGLNPIEIRANKKQLAKVIEVLWRLVDAAVEVVSTREDIARQAAYREVLENINLREGINLESSTEQTPVEQILGNSGLDNNVIEDIKEQYENNNPDQSIDSLLDGDN